MIVDGDQSSPAGGTNTSNHNRPLHSPSTTTTDQQQPYTEEQPMFAGVADDAVVPNPDSEGREPSSLRWARMYLTALTQVRYPVLLTWLVVSAALTFSATQLPDDMSAEIPTPQGTPSADAVDAYKKYFPSMQGNEGMLFIARATNRPVDFVADPRVTLFTYRLQFYLYTGTFATSPANLTPTAMFLLPNTWTVLAFGSYATTTLIGLGETAASAYLPINGSYSMYMTVNFNKEYVGFDRVSSDDFVARMKEVLPHLLEESGLKDEVLVTQISLPAFTIEVSHAVSRDIVIMFGVVTPITLAVFAYTLRSLRLVLFPLVALAVNADLAFAFLHFAAEGGTPVYALSPIIAAAVCLVLSITYTYTICCKFHRETLDQKRFGHGRHDTVLELVVAYSGRTVLVTSLTVSFCSLGLVFFPLEVLQSIGQALLFSSLVAMAVSINLVPCLFVIAPRFWERGVGAWVWPVLFAAEEDDGLSGTGHHHTGGAGDNYHVFGGGGDGRSVDTLHAPHHGGGGLGDASNQPSALRMTQRFGSSAFLPTGGRGASMAPSEFAAAHADGTTTKLRRESEMRAADRVQRVRFFYRHFIAFLCQWPVALAAALVMIGLSIYPMTKAFNTTYSNDLTLFTPRDSALLPEYRFMQRTFPAGELFPYNLIVEFDDLPANTTPTQLYFNPHVWFRGAGVVGDMVAGLPDTAWSDFSTFFSSNDVARRDHSTGLFNMTEAFKCFDTYTKYLPYNLTYPELHFQLCANVAVRFFVFANTSVGPATFFIVKNDFDPLSPKGQDWITKFRDLKPKIEAKYGVTLYLQGYGADTYDFVDFATTKFPQVVGIVGSVLFVSVGVLCVSIGIPLRALLIVFITTATSFGLATMVFVNGDFWWIPIDGLQGEDGNLAWVLPFIVLIMIVSISLHYDLSMALRVKQFHHHGHETRSAIILAAQETGSEISVSAGMMLLLFGGLVVSKIPVMTQIGFFLFLAALLQGLVYRLFLSTTIMSLLGEWNWFPFNLIQKRRSTTTSRHVYDADDAASDPLFPTDDAKQLPPATQPTMSLPENTPSAVTANVSKDPGGPRTPRDRDGLLLAGGALTNPPSYGGAATGSKAGLSRSNSKHRVSQM